MPVPDGELSAILSRRQNLNEAIANGENVEYKQVKVQRSVYHEFNEFSRSQIKEYESKFKSYNTSSTGRLTLHEIKAMMEKLGVPQTHLSLKKMIKEVDEDDDGEISFREFLLIFRKSASGQLDQCSGLCELAREIAVEEVGVGKAKDFFEAKISAVNRTNRVESELKMEQEEQRLQEGLAVERRQRFLDKAALFDTVKK